jgi:hypothetical protein
VEEDRVVYDMLYAVLTLDTEIFNMVEPNGGRFIRPESMHPAVVDLMVKILNDSDYVIDGRVLSWQHVRRLPFSEWSTSQLLPYGAFLLKELNFVHEMHCTRELYSSSSSTLRK